MVKSAQMPEFIPLLWRTLYSPNILSKRPELFTLLTIFNIKSKGRKEQMKMAMPKVFLTIFSTSEHLNMTKIKVKKTFILEQTSPSRLWMKDSPLAIN